MPYLSIIKINIFIICLIIVTAGADTALGTHSWQYYYRKGRVQFNAEMYDFAQFSLEKALELNPELYGAANILADIHAVKGDRRSVLEYLKLSITINGDQPDIHNRLGELYEYYFELDRAFDHFRRAVAADPDHARANMNLVRFYLDKGDKDLAKKHREISERAGEKISAGRYRTARRYEETGDTAGAIPFYRQIIEDSPAMTGAYFRLYAIYHNRGEFLKAAEVMERLVFLRPDYEKACIYLGDLYFTGKFPTNREYYLKRSIQYLKKAMELNPGNYDTMYRLYRVYDALGDDIKADEMLRRFEETSR